MVHGFTGYTVEGHRPKWEHAAAENAERRSFCAPQWEKPSKAVAA